MRTTIQLDDQLLAEAKQEALRTGRTLTALIEQALRESLARCRHTEPADPIELPTFGGRGLRPGVDLDDMANLVEMMERDDGAS